MNCKPHSRHAWALGSALTLCSGTCPGGQRKQASFKLKQVRRNASPSSHVPPPLPPGPAPGGGTGSQRPPAARALQRITKGTELKRLSPSRARRRAAHAGARPCTRLQKERKGNENERENERKGQERAFSRTSASGARRRSPTYSMTKASGGMGFAAYRPHACTGLLRMRSGCARSCRLA